MILWPISVADNLAKDRLRRIIIVAPSICWKILFTVSIYTLHCVRAVFGMGMYKTKWTSLFFLGMGIRGDNQGVAP